MDNLFRTIAQSDLQTLAELQDALSDCDACSGVIRLSQERQTYLFPDGKAWRYRQTEVKAEDGVVYTEAVFSDITELYNKNLELKVQIKRLNAISRELKWLSDSGRYELVTSLNGADIAILKCCQQHIDLILMDVCTLGNKDGIEAAAEIKAKFPNIRIVIVTSMFEVSYLERARAAGVDSFWYKDISPDALIDVIDRTMAGEHLFPNETPKVKLGLAESTELTAKEIEVLRLICDGLEYDEIAEKLDIAERTVKYHVSNILSKTGYANRTRLAIAVTNKKFIVPSIPEEQEFSTTE
ncbi:MAG TPA: hypothetical protein DE313_05405 [Ruminococcus sp.]|nr:hypothetical protein [Ruminococcus sp.]